MRSNLLFLFIISIFTGSLSAQDLPNYMTPEEQLLMPSYLQSRSEKSITHPPSSPVRAMAEWEEISGLCVRWTSNYLVS